MDKYQARELLGVENKDRRNAIARKNEVREKIQTGMRKMTKPVHCDMPRTRLSGRKLLL